MEQGVLSEASADLAIASDSARTRRDARRRFGIASIAAFSAAVVVTSVRRLRLQPSVASRSASTSQEPSDSSECSPTSD
jgi:hypothetical protein